MTNLSRASIAPEEITDFLKRELQLKHVCQKILHQKVINKTALERGITVTPEEIQTEANRHRYSLRLEKASDTLAWLDEQMITPDDWEAGISDRLLAKKLAESLFAKEVENFFAQNSAQFEQVLLYQIIVPYKQLAYELFYQIEEEEISFYEAAHLYDIDEKRRQQCGFEGKLDRWSLKPDIATVVFSANIKEVINPIQTEQGYHLLMVDEFVFPKLTPDRYREFLDKMFYEWLDSELTHILHSDNVLQ